MQGVAAFRHLGRPAATSGCGAGALAAMSSRSLFSANWHCRTSFEEGTHLEASLFRGCAVRSESDGASLAGRKSARGNMALLTASAWNVSFLFFWEVA